MCGEFCRQDPQIALVVHPRQGAEGESTQGRRVKSAAGGQ